MAKVNGVKEKLHMPLYDAFFVRPSQASPAVPITFFSLMTDPRAIRFFVDVQNKTRLDTNLQAAGVLPSLNSYEAHALRVVVSPINLSAANPAPVPNQSSVLTEDFLAELIYNSVTTFLVGEKTMIEAPTFWFPAGAGVNPAGANVHNHGEPDPMATFRFAEPVFIEPQQNFRVEISFPGGVPGIAGVPGILGNVVGPLRIWAVLDGYLTRDVQ